MNEKTRYLQTAIANLEDKPDKLKIDVAKELLIDTYKRCLFTFAKHGLGYKDVTWRTHGEMIKALEADSKRKLIVVPRDCFKSTISCVAYPIWLLIRDPNEAIMIDSEVYSNSKNFLREIKTHLISAQMADLFGQFKSENWNEGELTIKQKTSARKEASITCSGIGSVKVGQHYSRIIGDDYNSPNNSNNKEKCQKIVDHYQYNLSILDSNPPGTYAVIGTRYSENDLIGWILRDLLEEKQLSEGLLI